MNHTSPLYDLVPIVCYTTLHTYVGNSASFDISSKLICGNTRIHSGSTGDNGSAETQIQKVRTCFRQEMCQKKLNARLVLYILK